MRAVRVLLAGLCVCLLSVVAQGRADATGGYLIGENNTAADDWFGEGGYAVEVGVFATGAGCATVVIDAPTYGDGSPVDHDVRLWVFDGTSPSPLTPEGAVQPSLAVIGADGYSFGPVPYPTSVRLLVVSYNPDAVGRTVDLHDAVAQFQASCSAGGGDASPAGTADDPLVVDPSEGWGRFQTASQGLTVLLLAVLTIRSFASRTGD